MCEASNLWAKERKKYNLKYPDGNVIRFLHRTFRGDCSGKVCMDFGCGSGRNTVVMADLNLDIYAVDYAAACIELTKEKLHDYKSVHYIVNNEESIPMESELCDGIVAWGSLFCSNHARTEALLDEMARILKKGGKMLADFRSKDDALYGKGKMIEKDAFLLGEECGDLAGIPYSFYDIETLLDMYDKHGFKVYEYEKIDHWISSVNLKNSHYVIWAEKI